MNINTHTQPQKQHQVDIFPSNDQYYKLLKCVSVAEHIIVAYFLFLTKFEQTPW